MIMEVSELKELDEILKYIQIHQEWDKNYSPQMMLELGIDGKILQKHLDFLKQDERIFPDTSSYGTRYELKTGTNNFIKNGGYSKEAGDQRLLFDNNINQTKYARDAVKWSKWAALLAGLSIVTSIVIAVIQACKSH